MKIDAWSRLLGKFLTRLGSLRIVIADDEDSYFNPKMIECARASGFSRIERISFVTHDIFHLWLKKNPDIIILDVKNVVDETVAKDGIEMARTLSRLTKSMVVVTSAHQQKLRNAYVDIDYFIENRQLTSSDFIDELTKITEFYLQEKSRFYKNLFLKWGLRLLNGATTAPT